MRTRGSTESQSRSVPFVRILLVSSEMAISLRANQGKSYFRFVQSVGGPSNDELVAGSGSAEKRGVLIF